MYIANIIKSQLLDSTNEQITDYPENTLLIATEQTAGRGRNGHSWISPVGGLYMSYKFALNNSLNFKLGKYSFFVSIALHEVLSLFTETKLYIKWPNDLMNAQGEKLAGILLERKDNYLIVGIGVNLLDNSELAEQLDSYNYLSVNDYRENIALKVINRYIELLECNNYDEILKYYNQFSYLPNGSNVLLYQSQGQQQIKGQVVSLNQDYTLNIVDENNNIIELNSAYSIRPTV